MSDFKFSKSFKIGNSIIGADHPTYLIAEIGVNHNGDMDLARKMIKEASNSGADAVKFQTFQAENLVSKETPKVEYQKETTSIEETHYEMLKKVELKKEDHYLLKKYCESLGLDFISTPYDIESAVFLDELGVVAFKTASADLVDIPLQNWIAKTGKASIVSVGMATLGEVEKVIDLFRKANNPNLILLHCVSNYPASAESLNLRVMNTLQSSFDTIMGYSDHSIGSEAAILSLAYGAQLIEKHFTLDKNLHGPDHKASSMPDEFRQLAESVRRAEKMMGSPLKKCQDEEKQMAKTSRKSIVLAKPIYKNEEFTMEHLTLKRPGTGLQSEYFDLFLGIKASRDLKENHLLSIEDVK